MQLLDGQSRIAIIYLKGGYELIWSRLSARQGHYMKPDMLRSQFETLEEPKNALVLDISMTLDEMVAMVMEKWFGVANGS